jgi:tripartite-type tricarboxylate transporter receptor subunit TctC
MKNIVAVVAALSLSLCMFSSAYASDSFPSRAIKLVVPTAVGGANDSTARIIADELGKEIGQPVVVENKVGASGAIGARYVADASADGYTLFFGTGSTHVVVPLVKSDVSYDPIKDFTSLVFVGRAPFVLYVSSKLPVHSLSELIAYAKAAPEPLSFGTSGPATIYEIAALLLEQQAGIKLNHIPYKGLAPMALDVSAGRVDIGVGPIDGYLNSDNLRILAVLGDRRVASLPEIPSAKESGLPDFDVPAWAAIWGPAGLPSGIAERITQALHTVLSRKEIQEKIARTGIIVDTQDTAYLDRLMRESLDMVSKAVSGSASSKP